MLSLEPSNIVAPIDEQLRTFLDDQRAILLAALDGLVEAEARQRLVPSKTTLLGLVKHATFVERVWFEEAVTARPRSETGLAADPDESFDLNDDETIESVRNEYLRVCENSRRVTAELSLDHQLLGNRRGPLPLRWVLLHVLRELAQHSGHADILREQVIGGRRQG